MTAATKLKDLCSLQESCDTYSARPVASVLLTLGDSMDCGLPGSSVQRIFQVRILEREHSHLQGVFQGIHTAGRFFPIWATREALDKPRQRIRKQRWHFAGKAAYNQTYGFSSSHVQMWELDCEEGWAMKNWCFRTVVPEKTLESPLGCKEIQPVHPKGDQSWVFIGRTDEAEAPILWPPDMKSRLIGKDPDAGKDWRQK